MRLDGVGRDYPETTSIEVLKGLLDLGPGVHHERSVLNDGLAQWNAAN
jgi:hypothetical protein